MYSDKEKVMISVLTPSWNRSSYLEKVWEGLMSQTFRNFEWIVANDGSIDNTADVVKKLAIKSDFPVTLINASTRIGKARMDNEAVRQSQGEFILWCDSDDCLLPNAIEVLVNTWASIPESEKEEFLGVTALCESKDGVLDNLYPNEEYTDLKLNDLLCKMQYDMVLFARADELKKHPFLEVDFLIPETSVWHAVGVKKTRFIPIALKYINYGSENCISFSGLMEYNRGRAHAMAVSRPHLSSVPLSGKLRIWRLITYLRYCIHGEIDVKNALGMWGGGFSTMIRALIVFPLSFLLAKKDEIQGKVRKTHREYLTAENVVEIQTHIFNKDECVL